jgi:hypothetical protein
MLPKQEVATRPTEEQATNVLYATPEDALKKVFEEFGYWTGRLTDTSLQMCYGLIAANWLIFGSSVDGILHSPWAKWSLISVMFALATSVIGAWFLSETLRRRVIYGECDPGRWRQEFQAATGKQVAWPFTEAINRVGGWTRTIKAACTLTGGVLLIVGALLK